MSIGLVAGLVAAVTGRPAAATQIRPFTRSEQIRASDVILIGTVVDLSPEWDDRARLIVTDAEVAVDEVWKGEPGSDRVVVRTLGGAMGSVGLAVEGAARFVEGERVLLYLERDADHFRPSGLGFGKYAIESAGGSTFAIGSPPPAVTGAGRFERMSFSLEDLRAEVGAALEDDPR
jgi:hypothetical protein